MAAPAELVAAAPASTSTARGLAALGEVRLTLLGGFELHCAGASSPLPMAAQRLVSFLALQTRPLHRAHVAAALWFRGSDCDAQTCLRSTLWRVRSACSPVCVCASRTHVWLAPNVEVDVREQIEVARRVLVRGVELEAIEIRCLEGELLPDWYDDWVLFERQRLRQLRLHALETVALRLAEQRRYGEAVEAAFMALRGDELRESAVRVLVHIYLAEGNRAEAVRYFRRYRDLLRRRLGVDPSAELCALMPFARFGTGDDADTKP